MKEWVKKNLKYAAYIINHTLLIQVVVLIVIVAGVIIAIKIKIDMIDCQSTKEEQLEKWKKSKIKNRIKMIKYNNNDNTYF